MPEIEWKKRYQPPQANLWKGRKDVEQKERFFEKVELLNLSQEELRPATYAFIGFRSDEGVKRNQGRQGAKQGPEAIRLALGNLPLHQLEKATFIDVGDILCEDENLESAQKALGEIVYLLLDKGIFPIVLGGGHEVSWGVHQGIALAKPTTALAAINYDAHLDLRPPLKGSLGNSGTSFLQIAKECEARGVKFHYTCLGAQPTGNSQSLMETAKTYAVKMVMAEEFFEKGTQKSLEAIQEIAKENIPIHLSICLDVFATAFAPGVSSPQALGVFPWHVLIGLKELARSKNVICFDVAELAPSLDFQEITAKLTATLIANFLYAHFHS